MSRRTPGFRRLPRVADKMTPDHYACVDRELAASRCGDFAAALEWHQAVPMFRRGRHREILERLACLDDLPEWAWARTLVYQALRCEDGETGAVLRELISVFAETFHGDLFDECYDDGGDPLPLLAEIRMNSWAIQHFITEGAGPLATFVDEHARGRLAEHADLARSWVGRPMGGYQLGASLPGRRLLVREPDGAWIETLDLGARSCAPEDGYVVGRLVPSGLADLPMFSLTPLAVPEHVARTVADDPGAWLGHLNEWLVGEELPSSRVMFEDFELVCDVRDLDLLRRGTAPADLGRVTQQLREGRDEIARAAFRILQQALRGEVTDTDQAYVAAAALNVNAFEEVRAKLLRPGQYDAWRRWAELVAEPAAGRLLRLAEAARPAA